MVRHQDRDMRSFLERRAGECREDFRGQRAGTEHRKGDQYYLGMAAAFTEALGWLGRHTAPLPGSGTRED